MTAAPTASLSLFAAPRPGDRGANLMAAARALAPHLARSRLLDRKLVSSVMTTAFGASDAEGLWNWRDAYEAIEAATVLQIRRLAPQVARLEDAPAAIAALLATISGLGLTHSRRSEEQVAFDQFSTPPELAALVVLAAQVRPGDRVLEPSAGTGLIAVVAEACGGVLTLNERADGRAELLDGLFASATRSRVDGRQVQDLLPGAGGFDVAVCNPPFTDLEAHLTAAFAALADGGRLAAVVPMRAMIDEGLMRRLSARGRVASRIGFPPRAFAKHGVSVETGLLSWIGASQARRSRLWRTARTSKPAPLWPPPCWSVRPPNLGFGSSLSPGPCWRRATGRWPCLLDGSVSSRARRQSPMRRGPGAARVATSAFIRRTGSPGSPWPWRRPIRRLWSNPVPWPRWPRPRRRTDRSCRLWCATRVGSPTPSWRPSSTPARLMPACCRPGGRPETPLIS